MISQTAEYALRAVVYLGNQASLPQTTSQVSEATKAPTSYLSKILQRLVREGMVGSQRGPHGGFMLAREAAELSMLDVINAVDPIPRFHECPLGKPAHGKDLCALHRTVDEALARAEDTFRNVTIDRLLEPARRTRACAFPRSRGQNSGATRRGSDT